MSANIEALWREIVRMKRELARLKVGPEVFGVGWTDYSATSTIVGWSSFTTKKIFYCTVPITGGKLVFLDFFLAGTSNATSASLTVPISVVATYNLSGPIIARDNGAVVASPVRYWTGSVLGFFTDISGVGWTASGTKDIRGQMWYVG